MSPPALLLGALGRITTTELPEKERLAVELISKRWLHLKRSAQRERDPEKLIAILGEIEDLLADLEKKIAAADWESSSRSDAESRSDGEESACAVSLDNKESGANE